MPANVESLRALIMRLPVDPDLDDPGPHLRRRYAVLLVALGGVTGSLARVAVANAVPVAAGGWPTATFAVNVLGSFLLGALLGGLYERFPRNRWARPLIGTGFCGGFTTFSTFAVEVTARAGSGRSALAAAYVVASVAASLLAALVGVIGARSAARLTDRAAWRRRLAHAARLGDEDAA